MTPELIKRIWSNDAVATWIGIIAMLATVVVVFSGLWTR